MGSSFLKNKGLLYQLNRHKVSAFFVIFVAGSIYYDLTRNKTVIKSIENELKLYFAGALQSFKTPICLLGSAFQKVVWKQLLLIPYGKTISYLQQAALIGKKTAYRAVALANAANQINIVIPCHRVIKHSGDLGGYNGGVDRKKWLINHE